MKILILGAGAVGSYTAVALARMVSSLSIQAKVSVLDYDRVEERNLYSQVYSRRDVGKPKCWALSPYLDLDDIRVQPIEKKLTEDNVVGLTKGYGLILDCFDNIESRRLACHGAMVHGSTLMHVAISQGQDIGLVTWSIPGSSSFPYHPTTYVYDAESEKATEEVKLKPCELASKLPLIVNTSTTAALSVMLYMGHDITNMFDGTPCHGLCTTWQTGFGSAVSKGIMVRNTK